MIPKTGEERLVDAQRILNLLIERDITPYRIATDNELSRSSVTNWINGKVKKLNKANYILLQEYAKSHGIK